VAAEIEMMKFIWCATRKLRENKFHLMIFENIKLVIDKPKMTTPKTNELSDFNFQFSFALFALLNIHVFNIKNFFLFVNFLSK
jgi:hypothetical protein